MSTDDQRQRHTFAIVLMSPIFLGMAPVLGKYALRGGADPFTVAAVRTALAALIMWILYGIFWRKYIYIYLAGFLGCAVVGSVNGIGSLMYYNGLHRLDASTAQLLNGMYLIFVVLMARMGGQTLSWRTGMRTLLALFGMLLITGGLKGAIDWLGVGFMLGNSILFAGTIVLSHRVLWEMPAQTVALYVTTVMAIIVIMARVVYDVRWVPQSTAAAQGIVALAVTTALSRLSLFAGVKRFGSLQTTLLAITELAVAVGLSYVFLGESLTAMQWLGVAAFVLSLVLQGDPFSADAPDNALPMPNMAGITFQQIAFTHAFVNDDLSQDELEAIRQMMGVTENPPPGAPREQDAEAQHSTRR